MAQSGVGKQALISRGRNDDLLPAGPAALEVAPKRGDA